MFKKIVKNTGILSGGTFVSRILGVVRDIFIAGYFGTSSIVEAFIVAFRLPNILRSLLGEGFSDAVATPVFSEYRKDIKRLADLGTKLFSLFTFLLLGVVILGIVLAKPLVVVVAPGFLKDVSKLSLATRFTRITFLYLFFMGLVSVMSSLAYALKRFFLPAFLPCVFNICIILGLIFFRKYTQDYILVISVVIAGFLQFFISYIYIRLIAKIKLGFKVKGIIKDLEIKRMFRLFIPRIWSSIVYHLNVFVDTIFSSLSWIVGTGALAGIYYSNRIIQFPLALVGVSISRVAIVDFSFYHRENNLEDFKRLFVFSLENIIFFIIPISIFLIMGGRQLLEVLFMRGEFDVNSLSITHLVLFFYSFGLFFFCGIKLLVNSFYALKDTLTPAKTATLSLILNAILNALLMFPLKVGGIALASTIAAGFNFFLLHKILSRRIGKIPYEYIFPQVGKLIFLGVMIGITFRLMWFLLEYNKYIKLFLGISACGILFVSLGSILRVKQIVYVKKWLKERILERR